MEAVDLTGDPRGALVRLLDQTWQLTAESALLVVAAERTLPPSHLLAADRAPAQRVTELIERGRANGVFRTDLPTRWLVAVFHSIVDTGATELAAGHLTAPDAGTMLAKTLLAAFSSAD